MTDDTNNKNLGFGRHIPAVFNCIDLLIVNLLFLLLLRLYPEISVNSRYLRELWLLVNVCFVPVLIWNRGRRHDHRAIRMDRVFARACSTVGIHALFFLSLTGFLRIPVIPYRAYITYYAMMLVTLVFWQISSRYILKAYRRRGYNFTRVVIVGTGNTASRLYSAMQTDAGFGYKVCGFFDAERPGPGFQGKYAGTIDDLGEYVRKHAVTQIFYTLSGQREELTRVLKIADDQAADFYYVPQISQYVSRRFELHTIGSIPVMSMRRNPLKNILNRWTKRAFDFTVSSIFLCIYPLIYIPVAIAIKISSPGPVYFRQERTGYRGRSFECLKFRTMKVNTNADTVQATKDDPRKTRLGNFLRKTSIDELPQFINVWKGDMSIVGPRPHMLKHTHEYTKLVDRYMVRHTIKPGITGWAQVNGYRGITDELWKMEKRVEADVWYIENWSFLLDLKIMVRTVLNALGGEKNAF